MSQARDCGNGRTQTESNVLRLSEDYPVGAQPFLYGVTPPHCILVNVIPGFC